MEALDLAVHLEQRVDALVASGVLQTAEDLGVHARHRRGIGVHGADQLSRVNQVPGQNGSEEQRKAYGPDASFQVGSIRVQPM